MSIDTARHLRKRMTDAELRLWSRLRRNAIDGHRFRRQAPVGAFVVDFLCNEAGLVIEVDGGQHADRIAADAQRTRWLASQGFRVLRFWNNDVLQNTDGVIEAIRAALAAHPHPSPPPSRGRGKDQEECTLL